LRVRQRVGTNHSPKRVAAKRRHPLGRMVRRQLRPLPGVGSLEMVALGHPRVVIVKFGDPGWVPGELRLVQLPSFVEMLPVAEPVGALALRVRRGARVDRSHVIKQTSYVAVHEQGRDPVRWIPWRRRTSRRRAV
jgi:hypothetical protein